ncbi:hypothetical protein O6382_24530, partial [Salmonella enterica subsp. enterica]
SWLFGQFHLIGNRIIQNRRQLSYFKAISAEMPEQKFWEEYTSNRSSIPAYTVLPYDVLSQEGNWLKQRDESDDDSLPCPDHSHASGT